MVFLTSDTHAGHVNVINFCKRPFATVAEMNQAMIDRWNSVVCPDDDVYHLGDFAFGPAVVREFAAALNGRIHLCLGNHDYKNIVKPKLQHLFLRGGPRLCDRVPGSEMLPVALSLSMLDGAVSVRPAVSWPCASAQGLRWPRPAADARHGASHAIRCRRRPQQLHSHLPPRRHLPRPPPALHRQKLLYHVVPRKAIDKHVQGFKFKHGVH